MDNDAAELLPELWYLIVLDLLRGVFYADEPGSRLVALAAQIRVLRQVNRNLHVLAQRVLDDVIPFWRRPGSACPWWAELVEHAISRAPAPSSPFDYPTSKTFAPLLAGVKLRLVNDTWLARAYLLSTRDRGARARGILPTLLFYDKYWCNAFIRQCVPLKFYETLDVLLASKHVKPMLDEGTWNALCGITRDPSCDRESYFSRPPVQFDLVSVQEASVDTQLLPSICLYHPESKTKVQCSTQTDLLAYLPIRSGYRMVSLSVFIYIRIPKNVYTVRACRTTDAILKKPGSEGPLLDRHRIVYLIV